jgi:hypothetical protein
MPSHSHDIWDAAAGFPGGYVYSIAQTGDGYLWIGTSKGLVRYDGLTFVSIRDIDPNVVADFAVVGWSQMRVTNCGPQTTIITFFDTVPAASWDHWLTAANACIELVQSAELVTGGCSLQVKRRGSSSTGAGRGVFCWMQAQCLVRPRRWHRRRTSHSGLALEIRVWCM